MAATARIPQAAAEPDPYSALMTLRISAFLGALALAFLLDDPARNTTETTPTPRPLRTALRVALITPLAALWWTAALLLTPSTSRPPILPATLEATAMATAAIALAITSIRFSPLAEPGRRTATLTALAAAVTTLLPSHWGLLATPGTPDWQGTQLRWAAVLALTLLICTVWAPQPLGGRERRSAFLSPSGA